MKSSYYTNEKNILLKTNRINIFIYFLLYFSCYPRKPTNILKIINLILIMLDYDTTCNMSQVITIACKFLLRNNRIYLHLLKVHK